MKRALLALALAACAHAPAPPLVVGGESDTPGEITDVDPYGGQLVVKTAHGDVALHAGNDAELIGDTGTGWIPIEELRPGDDVRVAWRYRPDGVRELTRLRVLPRKGELPETEPIPPPHDDDTPVLAPAGGISPLPIGGR